ncbi:MAG: hypothetical protein KatS3mg109_0547 [Pirellulaceae bacterium]|nr:MAG: hypothetical protein KatS3mg109_0547 [Pirellulaceae bacterium]
MLVLSRRESERIRLGDNIVVTVVRVSGGPGPIGDRGSEGGVGVARRTEAFSSARGKQHDPRKGRRWGIVIGHAA